MVEDKVWTMEVASFVFSSGDGERLLLRLMIWGSSSWKFSEGGVENGWKEKWEINGSIQRIDGEKQEKERWRRVVCMGPFVKTKWS